MIAPRRLPPMPQLPPRPDEVDRIVEGWMLARPDLDPAPMAVLSRISRLARHLESARRSAFAATGLEGWEFDVLSALRRAGGAAVSPGALVQQTLVTSGTMSTRLEKLESRGLVARSRDPHDGRSVRVRLEPAGERLVDEAMGRLLDWERALLAALPPQEQARLAGDLRALLASFEVDTH